MFVFTWPVATHVAVPVSNNPGGPSSASGVSPSVPVVPTRPSATATASAIGNLVAPKNVGLFVPHPMFFLRFLPLRCCPSCSVHSGT